MTLAPFCEDCGWRGSHWPGCVQLRSQRAPSTPPIGATPRPATSAHATSAVATRDFSLPSRLHRTKPKPADAAEFWADPCWKVEVQAGSLRAPVADECVQRACPTILTNWQTSGGWPQHDEAKRLGCLCDWHGRGSIITFDGRCPILAHHKGAPSRVVGHGKSAQEWSDAVKREGLHRFRGLTSNGIKWWVSSYDADDIADACNDFWRVEKLRRWHADVARQALRMVREHYSLPSVTPREMS